MIWTADELQPCALCSRPIKPGDRIGYATADQNGVAHLEDLEDE